MVILIDIFMHYPCSSSIRLVLAGIIRPRYLVARLELYGETESLPGIVVDVDDLMDTGRQ